MKALWFFIGMVPEEGDATLVWASSSEEAHREGRAVLGYADAEYDECGEFDVHLATSAEILGWAASLVNGKIHAAGGTQFVDETFLDTDAVRSFLTLTVKAAEVKLVTSALTPPGA